MIMNLLEQRVEKTLLELARFRVIKKISVTRIETAPKGGAWRAFENGGEWGVPEPWQDFRFEVVAPEDFSGRVLLRAITGREGLWDATNPQFEARVDGRIEQALDVNHTAVELGMAEAVRGRRFSVVLNGYCPPLSEGEAVPNLTLTLEDEDVETAQLYYDISVPYQGCDLLPKGDRDREATLEILSRAIDRIDLRYPHSQDYIRSVAAAREYLRHAYYEKRRAVPPSAVAECVGHTHIDVAWLWDLEQTRHKAVRSFSTVLKLMDKYPEYKFMSSQAALYQMVKEDEPELYGRIKEAVSNGRWEPEGGMWLEADCNVTSGESLARQFLYGQMFFQKEFGKRSRILWLPDVFGYSAALPQLMKLSGIDYFMTTKLSWSEFNLTPCDTFLWKGIDDSSVLTHFSPSREADYSRQNSEDNTDHGLPHYTTYNALLRPSQIAGGWQRFQQKDLDDRYLVSYGYGDGGGGPTEWMLENGRRMDVPAPGTPAVAHTFALEFFQSLEKRVMDDPRLPRWSGELYLEYHRGTLTSMGRNKRFNRKIEFKLREVELLRTVAREKVGLAYPREALDALWRDVLTLQFHDILPGTSIKKVYDDSTAMYERAFEALDALSREAADALTRPEGGVTLVNTLSEARDDIARFDAPEGATHLRDEAGRLFPIQRTEDGCVAFVKDLPSMSGRFYGFSSGEAEKTRVTISREGFDTPFFAGKFDSAMRITSLVMKSTGREVCRPGEALNRLVCYEDKPSKFDAWEVSLFYPRKFWEVDELLSAEVVECGPARATLRVVWRYQMSTIRQDIRVYADIGRIDFDTTADWRESQILLKAHFPVDVFYNEATYDIQFGNIKRPTHKNTSWDVARFEVAAHKWADVSEDGFGVSLLNDCKYGHSADERSVALTLLRCAVHPNPEADKEVHHFTYSLYPHEGGWRDAGTPSMAYRLNEPVKAVRGDATFGPFAAVNAPNVMIEAVKNAEDGNGVILRAYECYGRRTKALLTLDAPVLDAKKVNILEETIGEPVFGGRVVELNLRPYEITTVRVLTQNKRLEA